MDDYYQIEQSVLDSNTCIHKRFIFSRIITAKQQSSSSSSSLCHAASTDIPDLLSPLLPIVHRLWSVFWATSRILTSQLYVCSSWSSCFCLAICGGPQEYITYELVPASPAVSCMSGSFNLYSFRDGRQVAVQLVPCGVLPPGLVQYCSQHSCVIAVQFLLQPFSQRPSSASICKIIICDSDSSLYLGQKWRERVRDIRASGTT